MSKHFKMIYYSFYEAGPCRCSKILPLPGTEPQLVLVNKLTHHCHQDSLHVCIPWHCCWSCSIYAFTVYSMPCGNICINIPCDYAIYFIHYSVLNCSVFFSSDFSVQKGCVLWLCLRIRKNVWLEIISNLNLTSCSLFFMSKGCHGGRSSSHGPSFYIAFVTAHQ